MRGFRVVLAVGVAAASGVAVLGCASSRWTNEHHVEYRMPQRFYLWVDATEQVKENDRRGTVAELTDALRRDIWRRGYDVTLVAAGEERDRYPRIELLVRRWRRGDEQVQLFKGFGEAEIDADCSVRLSPDVGPVFRGHLHGRFDLADYGSSATGAADAASDVIADAVLGPNLRYQPAPARPAPAESAPPAPPPPPSNVAHRAAAPVAAVVAPASPSPAPPPPPTAPPVSPAPAVPTGSFPLD
jgi:hypothetical protein